MALPSFIKRKEEIGMSPDGFHFRGIKKTDVVKINVIDYGVNSFEESELKSVSEIGKYISKDTPTWYNIDGIHDVEVMQKLGSIFNLDSIILSDVMDTHARAKVYDYDNCIYISAKMLKYDEEKKQVSSENVVFILKDNNLISFQEIQGDVFEPVRERIRKNKKRIRTSGTDYLAFALMDIVIDNYMYVIGRLGEKIEALEVRVFHNSDRSVLDEINRLKREMLYLKKQILPCREEMATLAKMESGLLSKKIGVHLKELNDNIKQVTEQLESYREMLSDILNIYHTLVSSKLNDIMKFLTIFSVVFIPLTFIAGIYGTNFDNVPELHYKYSYHTMWAVMVLVASGMILYFKKKKWF